MQFDQLDQSDSIEERTATQGLLLEVNLWDKPLEIKEFKTSLVGLYSQLLSLSKMEKQARENFAKHQQQIFTKVKEIRNHITGVSEKKNHNCQYVVIQDFLKIYSDVLNKSVEKHQRDAEFIESNILEPVQKVLKDDRHISDSIQSAIELVAKYQKEKRQVENYKKAAEESYISYEDTILIEDLALRLSSAYTSEPYSSKILDLRHPWHSKQYDYRKAVELFNAEAENNLEESKKHLKKCSKYLQDLSFAGKRCIDSTIKFYLKDLPEKEEWKKSTEEVDPGSPETLKTRPNAGNRLLDPNDHGQFCCQGHQIEGRKEQEFLFRKRAAC